MPGEDLSRIDGRPVLVCSTRDHRDPPTALRGSIRVMPPAEGTARTVCVELSLPEMFTAPAHTRAFPLDAETVERFLRAAPTDTLTCTLDYDFEQDAHDQTAVSPEARGGRRDPR